jgi:hypothetical protein
MTRLQEALAGAAFALMLLVGTFMAGRRAGQVEARTDAAVAAEAKVHAELLRATATADSLERITRSAVALIPKSDAGRARAVAKSDTALANAVHARESAERMAADSAATARQLRASIDSLAAADSVLTERFLNERTLNGRSIALRDTALAKAMAALDSKDNALAKAAEDYHAQQLVIADLKAERPGFLRRATGAVVAGIAAVGCGYAGSFGGPAAAVGAGAACAAGEGILFR